MGALALHGWLVALSHLADASDEARTDSDKASASHTMGLVCECVCDLLGLEEAPDLAALMAVAATAELAASAGGAQGGDDDDDEEEDAAEEEEAGHLEAVQSRLLRMKQFATILEKDIRATKATVGPMLDQLRSAASAINQFEQGNFENLCRNPQIVEGDEVCRDTFAFTIKALDAADPSNANKKPADDEGASKNEPLAVQVKKLLGFAGDRLVGENYSLFCGRVEQLSGEAEAGRVRVEEWPKLCSLGTSITHAVNSSGRNNGSAVNQFSCVRYLSSWARALGSYLESYGELLSKQKQLDAVRAEAAAAQKIIDEDLHAVIAAESATLPADVDPLCLRSVRKQLRQRGLRAVPRAALIVALQKTLNSEDEALELLQRLPRARSALTYLAQPSKLAELLLPALLPRQLRKVSAVLRDGLLLATSAVGDELRAVMVAKTARVREAAEAKKKLKLEAKAKAGDARKAAAEARALAKMLVKTLRAEERARKVAAGRVSGETEEDEEDEEDDEEQGTSAAEDDDDKEGGEEEDYVHEDVFTESDRVIGNWKDYGSWYPGQVCRYDPETSTYEIHYDDGDQEMGVPPSRMRREKNDGDEEEDEEAKPDASDESFSWTFSARMLKLPEGAEPPALTRAETALLAWLVATMDAASALQATEPQRQKVAMLDRRLASRTRDLDRQLSLKRAKLAAKATALGIDPFPRTADFPWAFLKERSAIEDELRLAIGLRDLRTLDALIPHAEGSGLHKATSSVLFAAQELCETLHAEGATTRRVGKLSIHDGRAVRQPSTPKQQAPADTPLRAELTRALDVFIEHVETDVGEGVPVARKFVDVLAERKDDFLDFLTSEEDLAMVSKILSAVSNSEGVGEIETEQCREQEAEKEKDQEQEQEIEMERYADLAYQRDGEEPRRWPFHALESPTELFEAGAFYPASDFRLYSRSSLPFPQYLHMSRNYFDLNWVGERRLKNVVCALDWVPSARALAPAPPRAAELSTAQATKLRNALRLLDTDGTGVFEASEVCEALRSAEDITLTEPELQELLRAAADGEGDSARAGPRRSAGGGRVGTGFEETGQVNGHALTMKQLMRVLTSGTLRKEDAGRQRVVLSLGEAETIRCALHLRQARAEPLVPGADVQLALRCVAAQDVVLDASAGWSKPPQYQAQAAHNCCRFIDCAMHFAPAELNILLRSIPAPPARRRIWFSMALACRRRMSRRWEQTPLARLFALEDEWSLLKQRAQAVRVRLAIRARGLQLHDAFVKFDADQNGLLSLAEVYGALDWLLIPDINAADILFFVRSITSKPHITYADFVEALCPPEELEGINLLADAAAADGHGPSSSSPTSTLDRQKSKVAPKGEAELAALLESTIDDERRAEAVLEESEAKHVAEAQAKLEAALVDSDFGWLRQARRAAAANPRTTRTTSFYDLSRGTLGSQEGGPQWLEGRGKWLFVKHGGLRCVKLWPSTFLVLRVPFRKNGGGTHLNQYTLSIHLKCLDASSRNLVSAAGWDQWAAAKENDEEAQLKLDGDCRPGALQQFGDGDASALAHREWHTVTMTVDTTANMMRTYVDGEQSLELTSPKVGRDAQFALKGRLALFYSKTRRDDDEVEYDSIYVRAVSVHNRVLSADAIKAEAAAFQRMLLEDAIAAAPRHLRAPLAERQLDEPAESLGELRERLVGIRDELGARASSLWAALLMRDGRTAQDLLGSLDGHQRMQLSHWRSPNVESDESAGIPGEHLLHAAAFSNNLQALELLLAAAEDEAALCAREHSTNSVGGLERKQAAGAGKLERRKAGEPPAAQFASSGRMLLVDRGEDDPTGVRSKLVNRRGAKTRCTPLHAAASAGHSHVIEKLIDAGAIVEAQSATMRTPLHYACAKGWAEAALALVTAGADPYRTVPGLETPIALLRKWAGADPKGEVAVRAIATLWEQNGGGDQEAAGDEGDDEGDDDEDEEARGVSESFGDSKRLGRGSKDSKNTSKDGTPPKRDGTTLDADHIDVDNLYGDEDDQLRRRDGDGSYADSDRETNSDAYEEDEEE